jgi:hypothetical protein
LTDTCGGIGLANVHSCSHTPFAEVSGLGGSATAVSMGLGFACAVIAGGDVMCWGANEAGQLGNSSTDNCELPNSGGSPPIPEVCSLVPVKALGLPAAGSTGAAAAVFADGSGDSACAITLTGGVLCWGNNGVSLGNGVTTTALGAVPVEGLGSGVTSMSVGNGTYCVIQTGSGGGLFCWGHYYLGNGTAPTPANPDGGNSLVPVPVTSTLTTDALAVSIGVGPFDGSVVCVWNADGTVACWGDDIDGSLGNGTDSITPTLVPVRASFPSP